MFVKKLYPLEYPDVLILFENIQWCSDEQKSGGVLYISKIKENNFAKSHMFY